MTAHSPEHGRDAVNPSTCSKRARSSVWECERAVCLTSNDYSWVLPIIDTKAYLKAGERANGDLLFLQESIRFLVMIVCQQQIESSQEESMEKVMMNQH